MKRLLTALVVVLAFAVPVSAQQAPSDFPPVPGGRHAEVMLSVSFGGITYSIDLETLLAGLVTFPDTLTRYVFQITWPGATPISVSATQIQGGSVSDPPGNLAIPYPPAPAMATSVSVGFAVPASVVAETTYASAGSSNSGFNFIGGYVRLPDVILMVGIETINYAVWVRTSELRPGLAGTYLFLDPEVQP